MYPHDVIDFGPTDHNCPYLPSFSGRFGFGAIRFSNELLASVAAHILNERNGSSTADENPRFAIQESYED